MASVSSLDKDLRNLRLSRYTPQAANEIREWIEEVLHEKLPSGDLLELLKSGVILCRLVNLAVSPGVKYRDSTMPFVQMENISHFLRACQVAPLNLQPHDVFLTVDLYESKDPAQVLQCIRSFSRRANALQPGKFPRAIGIKSKGDAMSPQLTGSSQGAGLGPPSYARVRGTSNASESHSATFSPIGKAPTSGRSSPSKVSSNPTSPKPAISAWTNKQEENTTIPAWNIHQYGYMGGANQGNLGISFGARRQITSPMPDVPSLAEKERKRREREAEEEKLRLQREDQERRQRAEMEEERRAIAEEERRWQEETLRLREKERKEAEEEKNRWAEQQRRWEEEERRRNLEEKEAEERLEKERLRKKELSNARLNGQFLSQYQASQGKASVPASSESERIKDLERQLELAKEREREYEREREELSRSGGVRQGGVESRKNRSRSRSRPRPNPGRASYDASSLVEERKLLRSEWQSLQDSAPGNSTPPSLPPRSLPEPPEILLKNTTISSPSRPLPDPTSYVHKTRTDRFLDQNQAPQPAHPTSHKPRDFSSTLEIDEENARRTASTQKTRAGGWASKSLLEREMERERERQREWEESQKQTKEAVKRGINTAGTAPGEGAWDVNQYGFMGGDNQNRGGPGLFEGARRQIIGPRPPP
ncbi:calponin homology domain-containing protein [Histoplasma capsulatum G186AR]|uniref:Calponin homology domain-containing protein n=2 Tax=Ajellomyces capsulatus TaxID=5037 RepID=C0NN70_AJECG|nr:calponin homology domain-containing protein [Histoplasma capsulatum G186AR]EEH07318.1 calponin homology domain-containing protein [Histoplasma capsulatum G186AR]KAG5304549.1 calponin homology domain-containing protein [Histoplasma capsulatum]QSS70147.1 calponin homology domain-containing protein [Histoplasma capsulatum G186AR]